MVGQEAPHWVGRFKLPCRAEQARRIITWKLDWRSPFFLFFTATCMLTMWAENGDASHSLDQQRAEIFSVQATGYLYQVRPVSGKVGCAGVCLADGCQPEATAAAKLTAVEAVAVVISMTVHNSAG
jgi:hypothetical protein